MSVEIEDRPRTLTEGFLADARRGMDIALPGRGGTAERFAHLRQCAAIDASLGRLVESHTDAVALLREAGRTPPPGAALAVWASDAREWLLLQRSGPRFRLRGTKQFCGGATLVDVALLTVPFDDAPFEAADAPTVLVIVPMGQPGIRVDPTVWTAPAFTDAGISTVRFDIELDASCIVGPPDFYTERPGFWQGAVGVAAVWAGIGDGLISRAAFRRDDGLAEVARGEIAARRWAIDATLAQAAAAIDRAPMGSAEQVALATRHVVASSLVEILGVLDQESGPAPIAFDPDWQRRRLELTMSVLQEHGRRDVASLKLDRILGI